MRVIDLMMFEIQLEPTREYCLSWLIYIFKKAVKELCFIQSEFFVETHPLRDTWVRTSAHKVGQTFLLLAKTENMI